jgi:hypothetical protein
MVGYLYPLCNKHLRVFNNYKLHRQVVVRFICTEWSIFILPLLNSSAVNAIFAHSGVSQCLWMLWCTASEWLLCLARICLYILFVFQIYQIKSRGFVRLRLNSGGLGLEWKAHEEDKMSLVIAARITSCGVLAAIVMYISSSRSTIISKFWTFYLNVLSYSLSGGLIDCEIKSGYYVFSY